ncbi:MAG: DUF2125 domain-containing protein [Pseudomonadota bacterium]
MMTQCRSACAALALMCSSAPAFADLTPAQVWADWERQLKDTGQSVTVEDRSDTGDNLRLTGVKFDAEWPEGAVSTVIDVISLQAVGDGTVRMTLSDSYPLALSMEDDSGQIELLMVVKHPDFETIASGAADAINYAYGGDSVRVDLNSMTVDGTDVDGVLSVVARGMAGTFGGALSASETTSSLATETLEMDIDLTVPSVEGSGDTRVTGKLNVQELASISSGAASDFMGFGSFNGFQPNTNLSGETRVGPVTFSVTVEEPSSTAQIEGRVDSSVASTSVEDGKLSYVGSNEGMEVTVSGSTIPLPAVAVALETIGFGLELPMETSNVAQDLLMSLNIEGLSVPDELWALVDPSGRIPRDPADLSLSLLGKGKWTEDVFSQNFNPEQLSAPPGELEAVAIDGLRLSVAGVELTGEGSFLLDNTGMEQGLPPRPDGAVDFSLTGINGLLDTLTELGLVPQDQATMGRMMLGMFTVPGTGPDTLTSRIEVKPDGSILANGQRIR